MALSGIESPRLDARLLAAAALDLTAEELIARPDRLVTDDAEVRFRGLIERRAAREPVSRILGVREFWSLNFEIGPAVLDPRPDSETLVEAALAQLKGLSGETRVLDLGTGSGCLLLSVLSEHPNATGIGVDTSAEALEIARCNAERLGLANRARFVMGDWAAPVAERFPLILSNPPYIPTEAIEALDAEVSEHDPQGALDGGADGLDAYRALLPTVAPVLSNDGIAVIEHGLGQAKAVLAIARDCRLTLQAHALDLAGRKRALILTRSHPD